MVSNSNNDNNNLIKRMLQINTEENKTGHDWVGKVIHWELSKKFKFDHTNKWYMHNTTSILDNETHKNNYGILTYIRIT